MNNVSPFTVVVPLSIVWLTNIDDSLQRIRTYIQLHYQRGEYSGNLNLKNRHYPPTSVAEKKHVDTTPIYVVSVCGCLEENQHQQFGGLIRCSYALAPTSVPGNRPVKNVFLLATES